MNDLISLFAFIVVAVVLIVLATLLMNALKVVDPARTIILVVLCLGVLLIFLRHLGIWR